MPYYNALPTALVPVHYDVAIREIGHTDYKGTVALQLQVHEPTDQLLLNYRDLTVEAVSATWHGRPVGASWRALPDPQNEVFAVVFEQRITPSEQDEPALVVEVRFKGLIHSNMAGFYALEYTEQGATKRMLLTQFEATDARRAFPCMDEPALKATFTVSLTTEAHLTALSNMPVALERVDGSTKTVTFEKSPIMSTYLVAWAIGEFEYVELFTTTTYANNQPLPVRIYTTPHQEGTALALELAPRIVDYYSAVFELKYPLPKLDLLAVHAFSHNAMENWGLITYRASALLYLDTLDPAFKQKVAYVVAHEIAHQWFGNLVTMQWWDELWLNEGFATWVGYLAVDHLFPEWDIFAQFASVQLQEALRLDGLRNSHPIKVPVMDALDIDQLFDAISYLKGAAVINMLASHLGPQTFLHGVARYLSAHQYANATSANLWAAIGEVLGVAVEKLMDPWISKIGFPVVEVVDSGLSLTVSQRRFLNGGGVKPEDDETTWSVPLCGSGPPVMLSEKTTHAPSSLARIASGGLPFRVNYSAPLLTQHFAQFELLPAADQIALIADLASLAVLGERLTTDFLDVVKSISIPVAGAQFATWHELCNRLATLVTAFGSSVPKTRDLAAKVLRPVVQALQQVGSHEPVLLLKLRAHVLAAAAPLNMPELQEQAAALFEQWLASGELEPALRPYVFTAVATAAKPEHIDALLAEVASPQTLDSRETALVALGCTADVAQAQRLMAALARGDVPVMDAHFLGQSLSRNTAVQGLYWAFLRDNYGVLHGLMASNLAVFERFLRTSLSNFSLSRIAADVEAFFAEKDTHGFERGISQAVDQIRITAAWVERDGAAVEQWLAAHL